MRAVLYKYPANEIGLRLEFSRKLQAVANKIHATSNIDEIMLDLSQDICNLFDCDRLTLYALGDDKSFIVSKIKTGLNGFKNLTLPVSEKSIAGYVAMFRKTIRINDVYDHDELNAFSPPLHFLEEVDRKTGYRTRQMLVAPLLNPQSSEQLLGVIQLINTRAGGPFDAMAEEGVNELCATLAIAFAQRLRPAPPIRSRYDALISGAVLSPPEFELATRSARRKGIDIEEVLQHEFQVKPAMIGEALGKFFGVPYEPFKADRLKPADLLRNIKREFVDQNLWLPIEENKDGLIILATDPEQVKNTRVDNNISPALNKKQNKQNNKNKNKTKRQDTTEKQNEPQPGKGKTAIRFR